MKSFRSTWILAIAVAAIAGYTWFDFKQGEKKTAADAEKDRVVQVSSGDVRQMKVTRGSETLILVQEDGKWRLTAPFSDIVDAETATEYLSSINSEKASDITKDAKAPIRWADYHLEPPGAAIEITKTDNTVIALSVSSTAAFDGSYFVRQGDRLLLGTGGWSKVIEKGASQLRSRRLMRQTGTVNKIRIQFKQGDLKDNFTLVKHGEKDWKIQESPQLVISAETVEEYITNLKNLRASGFQSESADLAARKKYGLDLPATRVEFEFEKQDPALPPWQLELSLEKENSLYGISSQVEAIFKVIHSDGEQVHRSRNYFRDSHEPFRLAVEQISEIQVKSPAQKWTFKKDGNEWKASEPTDAKADTRSLEKLVQSVTELRAKEFLGTNALHFKEAKSVEFRDKNGKPLLSLRIGEEFTPKVGPNKGQPLNYIKSSLSPELVGVAVADVKDMPLQNLTEKPAETQPLPEVPAIPSQTQ